MTFNYFSIFGVSSLIVLSIVNTSTSKIIDCNFIDGNRDGNQYSYYSIILHCNNLPFVEDNYDQCYNYIFQNRYGGEVRTLRTGNCRGDRLENELFNNGRFTYLRTFDISSHGIDSLLPEDINNFPYLEIFKAPLNKLTDIEATVFTTNVNLIEIDLSYNQISNVEPDAFSDLHRLQTLDLSNNFIETIYAGMFINNKNLVTLNVQDNRIKFNCISLLPLVQLTTLFVSWDNVTELDTTCMGDINKSYEITVSEHFVQFQPLGVEEQAIVRGLQFNKKGYKNLRTFNASGNHLQNTLEMIDLLGPSIENLDVSSNFIGKLTSQTFKKFINLKHLNLRDTKLSTIDSDVIQFLKNNKKLESLQLENNPIDRFDCEFFALLMHSSAVQVSWDNVKELNLGCLKDSLQIELGNDNDVIFSAPNGDFGWRCAKKVFQNLHSLNLSGSNLQDTSKLLELLGPSIETLDLSTNLIGKLNTTSFEKFNNLQYLNLSRTNLSNFEFKTFYHQRKLKALDISYNHLGVVNFTLFFRNFKDLKTLNLEGNDLTELNTVTKAIFPKLSLLGISKNYFSCDYLSTINLHDVELMYNPTPNQTHVDGVDCYPHDYIVTKKTEIATNIPKKVTQKVNIPETPTPPTSSKATEVTTKVATVATTVGTTKLAIRIQKNSSITNSLPKSQEGSHHEQDIANSGETSNNVKGEALATKIQKINLAKSPNSNKEITESELDANAIKVTLSSGHSKASNHEPHTVLDELRMAKNIFIVMIVICCANFVWKSKVLQKLKQKFKKDSIENSISYRNDESNSQTASVVELLENEN